MNLRFHLRDLVPLVGLAALLVLLVLAYQDPAPLVADFGEPPEKTDMPRPQLDVGVATLEGTLLGVDGLPVEGASLYAVRSGRPIWTFSDAAGQFRLSELDPGPVEIAIHAPGHQAALLTAEAGGQPVTLQLPSALPAPELLPDPIPVDMRGQIGAPQVDLSGFEVALIPTALATEPGTGVPRRVTCDSEGRFEVPGLTPAEYELLLLPPWATGGSWPDLLTPLSAEALRFRHPAAAPLRASLATGDIAGSASNPEGGPLEGALVIAIPTPGSSGSQSSLRFPPTRTGPDGGYRLSLLPPGRYRVSLTAGEQTQVSEVEVTSGAVVDPGF